MNPTLCRQLSLDYCCSEGDVRSPDSIFTEYAPREGRRRFDDAGDCCFLKLAAVNGKLLCTGRGDIVAALEPLLHGADAAWSMDAARLRSIDELLRPFGCRIRQAHPFYIAEHSSPEKTGSYTLQWYNRSDILRFRNDDRFCEAYGFCETAPDVLGVAAVRDGEILAMAGASADSPLMWQLGINVLPAQAGNGLGTALVTALKNAVLEAGRLPYYGTSLSHIASQRVALGAGFSPAWAELITEALPV